VSHEHAQWAEWDPPIDDDWNGADDYEMTEEDWAEAAERQAQEVAEDPEYAKWLDILRNSPAMRPWSPPPAQDDDDPGR
jgi:hypothetical protein